MHLHEQPRHRALHLQEARPQPRVDHKLLQRRVQRPKPVQARKDLCGARRKRGRRHPLRRVASGKHAVRRKRLLKAALSLVAGQHPHHRSHVVHLLRPLSARGGTAAALLHEVAHRPHEVLVVVQHLFHGPVAQQAHQRRQSPPFAQPAVRRVPPHRAVVVQRVHARLSRIRLPPVRRAPRPRLHVALPRRAHPERQAHPPRLAARVRQRRRVHTLHQPCQVHSHDVPPRHRSRRTFASLHETPRRKRVGAGGLRRRCCCASCCCAHNRVRRVVEGSHVLLLRPSSGSRLRRTHPLCGRSLRG